MYMKCYWKKVFWLGAISPSEVEISDNIIRYTPKPNNNITCNDGGVKTENFALDNCDGLITYCTDDGSDSRINYLIDGYNDRLNVINVSIESSDYLCDNGLLFKPEKSMNEFDSSCVNCFLFDSNIDDGIYSYLTNNHHNNNTYCPISNETKGSYVMVKPQGSNEKMLVHCLNGESCNDGECK